jgi:Fe-S-cluster-containing hydrogenase component 2
MCPVDALTVEPRTRRIVFDHDACIGCGHCVKICPPRAMRVEF